MQNILDTRQVSSLIKNTGWLLFDRVGKLAIGLFVGVWLARYLGPKQFGLLNYAISYVAILSVVENLGLESIVVKELSLEREKENVILGSAWTLKIFGALISVIVCWFSILPVSNSESDLLLWVAIILSIGSIFQPFGVIDYLYQAQMMSKMSALVRSCAFLVSSAIKVAMIYAGAGLIEFAAISTFEIFITSLLYFYTYSRSGGKIKKWKFDISESKRLLRLAWPLFFSGILVTLYIKLDQIMIGIISGDDAVGVFSVAVRLAEVWYIIPMAITSAAFPVMVKIKSEDETRYKKILENLYVIMTTLSFIVAITLTLSADMMVNFLFGFEYGDAGKVLMIQCWSGLFIFSGLLSNNYYILEGKTNYIFYRNIIGLALNACLNSYWIPRYGINGAAYSTLATQFVISYLFDIINKPTRELFWLRSKIYFLFVPMAWNIILRKKGI